MHRTIGLLAVAGALLVAAAPAPARTAHRIRCAPLSYETGGGYYDFRSSRIRATRVGCRVARRVARVNPDKVAGYGSRTPRFRSRGYLCRGRRVNARTVDFRCARGTTRITFTWTAR